MSEDRGQTTEDRWEKLQDESTFCPLFSVLCHLTSGLIFVLIPALHRAQEVQAGKKYFHQFRVKLAGGFTFDLIKHFGFIPGFLIDPGG